MSRTQIGTPGIADASVTTAKIADLNVTTAKIADSAVISTNIADSAITASKLNGNQTGTPPIYGVRAWINFDGVNAIKRSGGNLQATKISRGYYTFTFDIPMIDTNYIVLITSSSLEGEEADNICSGKLLSDTMTITGFKIRTSVSDAGTDTMIDPSVVSIMVMR